MIRAPYQKTAVPEVSEGDRSGHTMSSRGGRSILGQTVRGHELVRDTCKEGNDITKRSPAGKAYPWGAIDSTQQQKSSPFQDHPQYSQGNNPEKLHMNE